MENLAEFWKKSINISIGSVENMGEFQKVGRVLEKSKKISIFSTKKLEEF